MTDPQVLFGRKFSLIAYGVPATVPFVGPGITPVAPTAPGLALTSAPATTQTTPSNTGLDLSNMQCQFTIKAADVQSPKNLIARVLNLKPTTVKTIKREFSRIRLQAGYVNGPYGLIFDGTIKEVRSGNLDASTSFVDIFASDSDLSINFATINTSLPVTPGHPTHEDVYNQLNASVSAYGAKFDPNNPLGSFGGTYPRGKVLWGMWRDQMRSLTQSTDTTWFVENGVVKVFPQTGYLPGEVVVVTAGTGLIGVPEATQDGVNVRLLLNPNIQRGQRIQIDNKLLNSTLVEGFGFPNRTSTEVFASPDADGIYRVYVIEHNGDTRGEDWYTDLVCLAVNPTVVPSMAVLAGAS